MRRKYGIIIFVMYLDFGISPIRKSPYLFYVLDEILNEVKEHAVERRKNCNSSKTTVPMRPILVLRKYRSQFSLRESTT